MKKHIKNRTIFTSLLTCLFLTQVICQDNSCYKVSTVKDRVWTIVENNSVNIYVIEGTDSALIIDAGYGMGNLKEFVQTLTSKPLIMVNTHGHGDHTGADFQFSKVYAHEKEQEQIQQALNRRKDGFTSNTRIITVSEGYVFDLGGRQLKVIEAPGHTPGSIILLDSEKKLLFAGDHINAIVWLFLKGSEPLEIYLENLEKTEKLIDSYNTIMPGHNAALPNSFIYELISNVKSILDGTCISAPYDYNAMSKGALLCKFKTSEVAYDPNNLYKEKK